MSLPFILNFSYRNGAAITQNEAAKVAQEVIEAMATVPASLFDIGRT